MVLFLAGNPLIHPTQVGPMIDYLHNMRFAPRRIVRAAATGRRLHGDLTRVQNVVFQSWQPCGVRQFEFEEETEALGAVRWTVQELKSSWELAAEGTALNHCVVSYSDQCADGHTAVWSIGVQSLGEETRHDPGAEATQHAAS